MRKTHLIILFLYVFLCSFVQETLAKTWIEDFNEGHLNSWTKHDPQGRTTWQAKDGLLDVWLEPFHFQNIKAATYELSFSGFPLHAEELTVKVTILEDENAGAGIFIGQCKQNGSLSRRTYKFSQGSIWGPIEFPTQLPSDPFVHTAAENEIEIVFNKGHFQLLSEGEHIVDFHEPNLPTVDCLGIIVSAIPPLGHVVLDDFIISGPSIPSQGSLDVQPDGKAAVLWGELKRQ